jgi:glycosyltransferase involved in cell wall biosynthesis
VRPIEDFRISVIIPTLNRETFLPEAIRSVLAQSLPPVDVIVVDDGSTDATAAIVGTFGDAVRYIYQPNTGVSAARNRGIRAARGDWVAFLDSDDVWHGDKLRRQQEAAQQASSRVCFTATIDEFGVHLDDTCSWPRSGQSNVSVHLPGDGIIFTYPRHPYVQSLLVHRSALDQIGCFDEELLVAEDTKLVYRLSLTERFVVVHEPLTIVREHHSGVRLSDSPGVAGAYERFACYARVQQEARQALGSRRDRASATVRRNYEYFSSRQAEIACALDRRQDARSLAKSSLRASLPWPADWRNVVRSGVILAAYPLAARRFSSKWNGAGS